MSEKYDVGHCPFLSRTEISLAVYGDDMSNGLKLLIVRKKDTGSQELMIISRGSLITQMEDII